MTRYLYGRLGASNHFLADMSTGDRRYFNASLQLVGSVGVVPTSTVEVEVLSISIIGTAGLVWYKGSSYDCKNAQSLLAKAISSGGKVQLPFRISGRIDGVPYLQYIFMYPKGFDLGGLVGEFIRV